MQSWSDSNCKNSRRRNSFGDNIQVREIGAEEANSNLEFPPRTQGFKRLQRPMISRMGTVRSTTKSRKARGWRDPCKKAPAEHCTRRKNTPTSSPELGNSGCHAEATTFSDPLPSRFGQTPPYNAMCELQVLDTEHEVQKTRPSPSQHDPSTG